MQSTCLFLSLALLASLNILVPVESTPPPEPYNANCLVGEASLYNASQAYRVPWYTVNLDQEPTERFKHVAMMHKAGINHALSVFEKMIGGIAGDVAVQVIDRVMQSAHDTRMPQPYKDEITVRPFSLIISCFLSYTFQPTQVMYILVVQPFVACASFMLQVF